MTTTYSFGPAQGPIKPAPTDGKVPRRSRRRLDGWIVALMATAGLTAMLVLVWLLGYQVAWWHSGHSGMAIGWQGAAVIFAAGILVQLALGVIIACLVRPHG
jgi:hypothetical protein